MREARCEQQRRRLAEDAADGEDAARDHAVHAAWDDHGADDAPFARAQSERTLAVALRHGFQALLRRAHYRRQVHHRQCQRAREKRGAHAQELTEKQHADKTVDYRRDAGQRLRGVLYRADDALIVRVLCQVYRRSNPKRDDDNYRREHDIKSIHDIGQDAYALLEVARRSEHQLP